MLIEDFARNRCNPRNEDCENHDGRFFRRRGASKTRRCHHKNNRPRVGTRVLIPTIIRAAADRVPFAECPKYRLRELHPFSRCCGCIFLLTLNFPGGETLVWKSGDIKTSLSLLRTNNLMMIVSGFPAAARLHIASHGVPPNSGQFGDVRIVQTLDDLNIPQSGRSPSIAVQECNSPRDITPSWAPP